MDMLSEHIFGKSLENEYKVEITSFASFNRLLAKHEIQKELKYPKSRVHLSDNTMNMNAQKVLEDSSTYGQLGRKEVNELDAYKKSYKLRSSKKYGLAKLECYCEKMFFDKMDDIYILVTKLQNDKKLLKRKLYNKYGIRFIIIALVPLLGLIIPILFSKYSPLYDYCPNGCNTNTHMNNSTNIHKDSEYPRFLISDDAIKTIYTVNKVFLGITCFVILLVIFYMLIKFIKYEKLRECKVRGR
ncbi:Plasmodium exported protein, unknown function [Plasmodium vivax]|uniref:Variable surface protein n=1 Tax=Plasmodium vivax TaxID=5855 RepID=A0A565A455_PLAVI|nr:Plasmodium exported protein, unknown function [Plasmodium vivax]